MTQIGSEINGIQKDIGKKKKDGEDAAELLKQKLALEEKKTAPAAIDVTPQDAMLALAKTVGNYVDDSVPVNMDEDHNEIIRTWGDFDKTHQAALSHHEIRPLR